MLRLKINKPVDVHGVQEIRVDQTPTSNIWNFIPLFNMTLDRGLVSWQIGYNDFSKQLTIIHEDENGGNMTETCDIIDGTDGVPAIVLARQKYCQKYHTGYRPAGDATPTMIVGMKGYRYEDKKNVIWPAYIQPKLHGIRMLCFDNGRNIVMGSYQNTSYTHLSHISDELKNFFSYLPRYAMLDGELYNHTMDFGTIASIVKTSKKIHPQLTQLRYHIFDIAYKDGDGAPFEKRYELLVGAFRKYIQDRSTIYSETDINAIPQTFCVVACQLAHNEQHMMTIHKEFVAQGYEGSVIKKISHGSDLTTNEYKQSLYKSGKCANILKYKDFYDEEAVIIAIKDNNIFEVRDTDNRVFLVKSRITAHHDVIGKRITYRYQTRVFDGTSDLPENPIAIAIRDYE
jgi:hypothetical protein